MQKSVVSIVKGTDPEKMIEEALDLLGGVTSLIKPGSVVAIKPNAGHNYPPETSVCTSQEVVAATIKVLRKANPKEIILTEAAAIGCDTLECFEISGMRKAAEDAGVDKIIDIKRERPDKGPDSQGKVCHNQHNVTPMAGGNRAHRESTHL